MSHQLTGVFGSKIYLPESLQDRSFISIINFSPHSFFFKDLTYREGHYYKVTFYYWEISGENNSLGSKKLSFLLLVSIILLDRLISLYLVIIRPSFAHPE